MSYFYWSFLSDVMAVKGLTQASTVVEARLIF